MLCFQELHSTAVQEHSKRNTTLLGVGEPLRDWHFAGNSHFNSVGFSELVPTRKTLCTCNLNFCSLRMSQLNKHKRMLPEGLQGQKSLPQVQLELRTGYTQAKFNSRISWWNKVFSAFLFRLYIGIILFQKILPYWFWMEKLIFPLQHDRHFSFISLSMMIQARIRVTLQRGRSRWGTRR